MIGLMIGLFIGVWIGSYMMFRWLGFSNHDFWHKTHKELLDEIRINKTKA